jgi:DNA-binding transcriptional LysR family regulator
MNWDDLRFLVVIARETSLAAAARRLKVDPTTVARRLRGVEDALGAALFVRRDGRWRPTPVGEEVLARALRIEEDIAGLGRVAAAGACAIKGLVRITAVGTVLAEFLLPRIDRLYLRHPDIRLEMIASNANLSVARRETDIAIRLARPESGDFLIRKLADCAFAPYAPADGPAPRPGDWVGYETELEHTAEMRWLAAQPGGALPRLCCNSVRGLAAAIAGGVGCGILPCFVGDADPRLARSGEAVLCRELWLLIHRDARQQAAVAAVADWLVEHFTAAAAAFRGDPPAR